MIRWLVDRLIAFARARPYRKGHLYHPDGSLYMGRYALFETRWLSARVHHIATADHDRHLHDHPWNFASLVLRGGYVEQRPVSIEPCFAVADEETESMYRPAGSIAFRRATDRHADSVAQPDTWTLFVYGAIRQWWGFYTRHGKIHWRDYLDVYGEKEAA